MTATGVDRPGGSDPAAVVALLIERGLRVATAESLTGGLVCAALTSVPGASAVVRGAVVAYDPEVKVEVLGVERSLLARVGAVDPVVAEQMARGARGLLGADLAVATTGEAGPSSASGAPVGTVIVAVTDGLTSAVRSRVVAGDRAAVRSATVDLALLVLAEHLGNTGRASRR